MQNNKSFRSILAIVLSVCVLFTGAFMGGITACADTFISENPPQEFYTFSSFGVSNGAYATEQNRLLTSSLMSNAFSGYVTFSGEYGQQLMFGGNNNSYGGLYFLSIGSSLAVLAYSGEFDNVIFLDNAVAGTQLLNNEFKLTFSLTPVGNGDVKLGLWFDDVLYNNSFITLSKSGGSCETLFGAANGLHITPNGGSITVRSIVPAPPESFQTFSDVNIADGTLTAPAEIRKTSGLSLMGGAFSGYVNFSGESGQQLILGGNGNDGQGLYFFPLNGNFYLLPLGEYYDNQGSFITFTSAIAGTTLVGEEFKLTVSLTPVGNGDVRLGVWFNDVLYNGSFFILSKSGGNCEELFGYANSIYVAANNGTVAIRSVTGGSSEPSEPSVDYTQVTFERVMPSISLVSGSNWGIYVLPESQNDSIPGTAWQATFANVDYSVNGADYTAIFTRADDINGLYFQIQTSVIAANAAFAEITIKAGEYLSNIANTGIEINDDFTFYCINGVMTSAFDPESAVFSAAINHNADDGAFVIGAPNTYTMGNENFDLTLTDVNIDGVAYAANSTYNTVGDHTMTYSLFGNEYTCDFIVYYAGDANGDGEINVLDMIAMSKMQSVPGNSAGRTNAARHGADINSDGTYGADDLVLLKKILLRINDIILIAPAT